MCNLFLCKQNYALPMFILFGNSLRTPQSLPDNALTNLGKNNWPYDRGYRHTRGLSPSPHVSTPLHTLQANLRIAVATSSPLQAAWALKPQDPIGMAPKPDEHFVDRTMPSVLSVTQ